MTDAGTEAWFNERGYTAADREVFERRVVRDETRTEMAPLSTPDEWLAQDLASSLLLGGDTEISDDLERQLDRTQDRSGFNFDVRWSSGGRRRFEGYQADDWPGVKTKVRDLMASRTFRESLG